MIAASTCLGLALAFAIVRSSWGDEERIGLAWLLVFIVSRTIMVRGYGDSVADKLRAIISDPVASEDRREWARSQLARLGRKPPRELEWAKAGGGRSISAASMFGKVERLIFSSSKTMRAAPFFAATLVVLNILLLFSGQRLLVDERVLQPGSEYEWDGRTFGDSNRPIIFCRYWTGRSIQPKIEWHGFGQAELDECPFLARSPAS